MLGSLLQISGTDPVSATAVTSAASSLGLTGSGTVKSASSSTGASPGTAASGTPVWQTAYASQNFTNNDLGNNDGAPSMQATLNDPHAAILAPPVTQSAAASAPGAAPGAAPTSTLNPDRVPGVPLTVPVFRGPGAMVPDRGDPLNQVKAGMRPGTAVRTTAAAVAPVSRTMTQLDAIEARRDSLSRTPNAVLGRSRMIV